MYCAVRFVKATLLSLLCAFPVLVHAQTTTVTFDNPIPSGAPDSFINGVFQGIDFGSSQWRWSGPFGSDPTNNVYFANSTGTSRTFSFSPGPRVLTGLTVYTVTDGTLTLSDGLNPTVTRAVTTGSLQAVTTGWSQASTTITVGFTAGWALGVDDIIYSTSGSPTDTTPPTVSMTAPSAGSALAGNAGLTAIASDNTAVAGVQFLVDGIALGAEDTVAPYAVTWDTTAAANGSHILSARARDTSNNLTTSSGVSVTVSNAVGSGFGYALRFNGAGVNDIDRVKIRIDDPANTLPGPPVDVGATDFTLEFWINGSTANNPAPIVSAGANNNWIFGNIVVDRDRFNQDCNYGISFAGGRVVFGVAGQGTGNQTIVGTTNVLDNAWHHVAVQRRRTDGWMWIYVDGVVQTQVNGPDGDISYPDNGVPGNFCSGGPCTNSDPFIVLGAEKHDAGPAFPAYDGLFDEFRVSTALRYSTNFTRPNRPFAPDSTTVGLYHFDEGQGDYIYDSSGAFGGPSLGTRRFGGSPAGPEWLAQTPFTAAPASEVGEWAGLYTWPIIQVHAAVLRTGQLLLLDGNASGDYGGTSARLWNPATGVFTQVPNLATDMFCGAHSFLPDGRLVIAGGNEGLYIGLPDTNIFDPSTSQWSRVSNMRYARWYPTTVTLGDGRILVMSGSTTCDACIPLTPEVYNPATNTWTELTGAPLSMTATYPHLFLLPDGRVLMPASNEEPMATRVLNVATQTWTTIDPNITQGGAAVMYQPGRVMKSGSASDVDLATALTVPTTYVIDMNQASPAWRTTEPMAYPRGHHNLIILPDGTVFVSGGGRTTDGVNIQQAVLESEIWSPETESWTTVAAAQRPRLYHQTALLLPDGRVLSAGSGRYDGFPSLDQFNAEFYAPPYLFRGERPIVTSIPASAAYGATIFVGNANPANIERVTLLAPSATTHQVNMQQRFLELTFQTTTNGLNVQMPANPNAAPPGYYMLFLIGTNGVPSVASFVQVSASATPAPVPATISIAPASGTAGGAAFTLTVNGSGFTANSVVRWNGNNRITTFGSANQLTATITTVDIAAAGSGSVTVFTPAPGGGTSNAQTFTINASTNPAPTTTSIAPTSATAGSASFALTVNGTGFVNGASVVRVNGSSRTTTFNSVNQLTATVTAADIATAGTRQITVFTSAPGGGTSNAQTLTVVAPNPVPATTSLSPTSAIAGSAAFTLTVNGSNFINGSTVRWNGANRTTAFVSANQLTASITATDIAAAGSASVTVFTAAPGGGTSNAQTFTITGTNPVPATTGLSPTSAVAGGAAFTLTVNGSNFINSSTVRWNGANRTTAFVSANQLTASITAADIATAGSRSVAVFTAAPGGGTSNAQTFSITTGGGTPQGLVAAYGMNAGTGTAVADSSTNGNNGTVANGTWTASGRFGSALVFNGTSTMVTVPDSASLDLTTGMTLSAWVYPTVSPSGWRAIVGKELPGGMLYYLHASSNSNRPATGLFAGGVERILFGGSNLAANTWVHIASTYDGVRQRIYINGAFAGSRQQTGAIATSSGALRIGGNVVYGEYFQGRIDEVRVYNRLLTDVEIRADMNTPVAP